MISIRRIFHPEIFQGTHKTKQNYFEGWYFKVIDKDQLAPLAVIPGVSYQKDGKDAHAFIQVMDVKHGKVHYIRFPLSDFRASPDSFQVWIGDNYFCRDEIRLNLETEGGGIKGHLRFDHQVPYPKTLTRPGIMGPYTFIPWMECYHGIVNIHHQIQGTLDLEGAIHPYDGGYGYIEKDWGTSFPKAWIWLQSNHFTQGDVTLMFSYADIPWLGRSFMGLISFLRVGDQIYHFATYTRAKIIELGYLETGENDQKGDLTILLSDRHHRLAIRVENAPGGALKAPKNGLMEDEITESISGVIHVKLEDKHGNVVFQGTGTQTGVEISTGMEKRLNAKK